MAYMRWAYDPWYIFWQAVDEGREPRLAIWPRMPETSYSKREVKDLIDVLEEWLRDLEEEGY